MSDAHILVDRSEPRIMQVTFNRPEARNAMTFPMYDRLAQIARLFAHYRHPEWPTDFD